MFHIYHHQSIIQQSEGTVRGIENRECLGLLLSHSQAPTYSSNCNAILSQLKSTTEQRKEVEKPIKFNSMCGNSVCMYMSGKANMRTNSSFHYYIIYSHHDDGLVCCAFQVSAMNFTTYFTTSLLSPSDKFALHN